MAGQTAHLTRRSVTAGLAAAAGAVIATPVCAQKQAVDAEFEPEVADPAFQQPGPRLVIDEAHENFHTFGGGYAPFARLMALDGWTVEAGRSDFTPSALEGVDLLVIANAGGHHDGKPAAPAFSQAECRAVERWVAGGGALLLIADHAPFGRAAQIMAEAFGFRMGGGWVYETTSPGRLASQLVFSRQNGGLGDHPILRGRNEGERISAVRTFTGQSLTLPAGAVSLFRLGDAARETPERAGLDTAATALKAGRAPDDPSVAGLSQGFALERGKGRLVVLGEAGMLSAQMVTFPDGRPQMPFGMNVPGYDNMQFALNAARWLARAF